MMQSRLALATIFACVLFLSGCFGYPAGTVRAGDSVGVLVDSTSIAGGTCYAAFVAGEGSNLLGEVSGHRVGDVMTVQLATDAPRALDCHPVLLVDRSIGSLTVARSVARTVFEQVIGVPTVGQQFVPNGGLASVVTAVNATTVSYELVPSRDPYPELGLDVVFTRDGANLTQSVEANVTGVKFQGPIQGLVPAGEFVVAGQRGDNLIVARTSTVGPDLVPGPVSLRVTIVATTAHATFAAPVTGTDGVAYGHRSSPHAFPAVASPSAAEIPTH